MNPTRKIKLNRGLVAVVDARLFQRLNRKRWFAHRSGKTFYAVRGFRVRGVGLKTVYMHREIIGASAGEKVDHRDGDGLNNRISNLRFASSSQNNQNRRKQAGTSSRFKGVSRCSRAGRWVARLRTGRRLIYAGLFLDETEAARAYDRLAIEHFGEFARLNFPERAS